MVEYVFSAAGAAWLVVSGLFFCWVILTWKLSSRNRTRNLSWNIGMIVFSTLYTFLAADLIVGTTVIETNALGVTLAHQRWARQYWLPTLNSYGYRDIEPQPKERNIIMLGASFAAGVGIDRLEDTMTAVLRHKLGSDWSVGIVAQGGWDTRAQLKGLMAFPVTPNIIIANYTPFDILGRAIEHGLPSPFEFVRSPPSLLKPLIDHSSLANWLYWRFQDGALSYWPYVVSAHKTPAIFDAHASDLQLMIRHSQDIHAKLYFVLWPALNEIDSSAPLLTKIGSRLSGTGAQIIDLMPHLRNIPVKQLIVSPSNPHPSAWLHHKVADIIFERIESDGWMRPEPDHTHQTVRSNQVPSGREQVQ